jgi:hypothetical protein
VTPRLDRMEHEKPQSGDNPRLYEPPTVTDYGSLADITAGGPTGAATDREFPTGTPASDLTFSG